MAFRGEEHRVVQSQPLQLHDQLPDRQHVRNAGAAEAQRRRDLEGPRIRRQWTLRVGPRPRRKQSRTLGADVAGRPEPDDVTYRPPGRGRFRQEPFFAGASSKTYSCCASRVIRRRFPSLSATTNSNPSSVGSIVMNEIVPSSFFLDATTLFPSPTSPIFPCPSLSPLPSPSP